MITRAAPPHRISSRVSGPTRNPVDRVAPASPADSAAMSASTNTSATVTARLCKPVGSTPVNASRQIDAKASARRCPSPCPCPGSTGSWVSRRCRACSTTRPSIPGSTPHSLYTASSREGWITRYRWANPVCSSSVVTVRSRSNNPYSRPSEYPSTTWVNWWSVIPAALSFTRAAARSNPQRPVASRLSMSGSAARATCHSRSPVCDDTSRWADTQLPMVAIPAAVSGW